MSGLLQKLLKEKGILLADGATGSNLFARGLQTGDSPELWNDLHPDRIAAHYRSFIDAGSDIVLTNTFGGTRYRLKLHDAADRVGELNHKGAQIALGQVAESGREVIVGGSMGPTGEIMAPLGSLSEEDAAEAFEEQAIALREGGVDVLWIENHVFQGGGQSGSPRRFPYRPARSRHVQHRYQRAHHDGADLRRYCPAQL